MVDSLSPWFRTAGRILLVLLFIKAGWDKIGGYEGTAGFMESVGVPGMLLPLVIIVELIGGLFVLVGLFTRFWAFLLAGFCILAAFIFHPPTDPKEMISFLKDISIAGGFLMLVGSGPGALALDHLFGRRI
ncbi:Inner membrane protein YqjF [Methyloligella halotolerans]|uniref:Inner membrane protein YqjF n=1 Tax=Methyloligella halotolerans TaxID=1177755 RepID=A0A1E2RVD6_9HYPH|nr:DoxX family protein [Methyloligella halotolerans]ODA66181.1 Inner membrane protein YqjF [Methyloligella halotolerans]